MTPIQRLLKDLRNPLLTQQTTEALEDSYIQLERAWLHARMYEAMDKRMEDIDEIIKATYER
jgi:hypothetical protein